MATGNVNNRSQMKNIRFPHDVIEQMEATKKENETIAGFVVTAVRGEIARRQLGGTAEDALASARAALTAVRDNASKAGKEIEAIIASAEKEIGGSAAVPDTPSPQPEEKPQAAKTKRPRFIGE